MKQETDHFIPEAVLSKDDLRAEAEQLAQDTLGLSAGEAYELLGRGEYAGTTFAARMSSIQWLLVAGVGSAS